MILKRIIFLFIAILGSSVLLHGQVRLPKLVSDGMVLQRDVRVRIWGWASAGEKVAVHFADGTYNSVANDRGEWEIMLPKLKAGGPFTMVIKGKNELVLNDILIGDVWVASGQSNMEMSMRSVSAKYPEDIAASENKFIRQFAVPRRYIFSRQMKDVTEGSWVSADPNTVLRFTAVGYFFANDLHLFFLVQTIRPRKKTEGQEGELSFS